MIDEDACIYFTCEFYTFICFNVTLLRSIASLTVSKDGKTEKIESHGKDIGLSNIDGVLKLIVFTMKMNGVSNHRGLLEPISKVVSYAILFCTFNFQDLIDICYYCNKTFTKDRDKSFIIRTVIAKFIDALRYKTSIPDVNFLYLASMILQDAKGELPPNFILDQDPSLEMSMTGIKNLEDIYNLKKLLMPLVLVLPKNQV